MEMERTEAPEERAVRAERQHWMAVAQEIGEDYREQGGATLESYGLPQVVTASRHLAHYARWQDCVDRLGITIAVRHARTGYMARDQAIYRERNHADG